jgi:hypothetical protein
MSPHDDVDSLISELGASLPGPQYRAFEVAARAALGDLACSGPGIGYRILRDLQRSYYDYPPDLRVAAGPKHYRAGSTKLAALPPVGAEDPRGTARRLAMWARR